MSIEKRFVAKNGLDNNNNSITNLGTSGASLALSGAFAGTFTLTGTTDVTFPTSGTLATTAQIGGYVLKVGDTMTGPLIISSAGSADILRVTNTGTGNSFVVEDSTNPDASPFVIGATGNTGIGTDAPTSKLHISGTTSAGGVLVESGSASLSSPVISAVGKRSDANASQVFSGKLALARNRTDAAISSGLPLGTIYFGGNHTDGTLANVLYSASISGISDGTFSSSTDMPAGLAFYTGSAGTTTDTANVLAGTLRMKITAEGLVGIGVSSPSRLLSVGATNDEVGVTAGSAITTLHIGGNQSATGVSTIEYNRTTALLTINAGTVGGTMTTRLAFPTSGAIGIGGANYGTTGQVLTSSGSGAAPSWASSFTGSASLNVLKSGDTMSSAANLTFSGGGEVLGLPQVPSASTAAASKYYVDAVASGLNAHAACVSATTATLAVSSAGTVTYSNGTAGVGATLTTTGTFNTLGGIAIANGDRVLVKNEATQANNGIYTRTSSTVLTRADDFDNSPSSEISAGDFVYIQEGTLAGTQWVQTNANAITVGTTAITFTQLSGTNLYSAGNGITLTGTTFSVAAGTGLQQDAGGLSLATAYGDTLNPYASKTAKTFLAAPNAATGVPTFRTIVASDIPTLNQSTTGSAATLTTPRAINGTNFDGSANITTANWGTARDITIGGTTRSVNGSAAYSWSLIDIGVNNSTLTLATAGIATGSQTWTSNQGTNATFTVTVPATNIAEGTRTTTAVPITSSTGTGATLSAATTLLAGVMTAADKTKLDGIATGANNYTLPAATSTVIGGVELFSDTVQTVAANAVTTTASRTYGLQVNAAGQLVVNVPWVDTDTAPATNIAEGTRTTTTVPVTSSTGTGATLSAATTSLAGVMTAADKTKLDGIATSANNYTLPAATSTTFGGVELFSDTVQSVASNAVTATASRTYGLQVNASGQLVVNVPWADTNWYPTGFAWTAGTTAGPTGSLTGTGMTAVSYAAIPSASATASGIVTTDAQTFAGAKTFSSVLAVSATTGSTTISSTTSSTSDITGALVVSGGIGCKHVYASGDITAFSDARIKTDVQLVDHALEKIEAMRGVTYVRTDNGDMEKGKRSLGVIAQEVLAVLPEAVVVPQNAEEMHGVNYGNMAGLFIEAIKDLSRKISELESKIAKYESTDK